MSCHEMIFLCRFTQAGSEVSALLGRIPSAVGYQPTLATDMGTMQERITTTQKGSITSVQVCHQIIIYNSQKKNCGVGLLGKITQIM